MTELKNVTTTCDSNGI